MKTNDGENSPFSNSSTQGPLPNTTGEETLKAVERAGKSEQGKFNISITLLNWNATYCF